MGFAGPSVAATKGPGASGAGLDAAVRRRLASAHATPTDDPVRRPALHPLTPAPRPRRSALYLPASNSRALAKARTLACDVVILDLEDAVAPQAKAEARAAAVAAVRAGGWGRREVVVRVNALDTPWGDDDLAAVAAAAPDAVLVPKVDGAADLARYAARLAEAPAHVALWAMVETGRALFALPDLAASAAGSRLAGLVLGANDLAQELGWRSVPGRAPLHWALSATTTAAHMAGLLALDGVYNALEDAAGLAAECRQAADWGFDGKTLIHPAQVEPCNRAFAPSDAELAHARAVIAAFEEPGNAGRGAIRVDGRMIERLHLRQAEALAARAVAPVAAPE